MYYLIDQLTGRIASKFDARDAALRAVRQIVYADGPHAVDNFILTCDSTTFNKPSQTILAHGSKLRQLAESQVPYPQPRRSIV